MTVNIDNARATKKKIAIISNREFLRGYKLIDISTLRALKSRSEIIDLRLYTSRYNRNGSIYAIIYFWDNKGVFVHGVGRSSGGSYRRSSSAAVADALRDCGVSLSHDIDGRGDVAIKSALIALGAAVDVADPLIVEIGG